MIKLYNELFKTDYRGIPLDWEAPKMGVYFVEREEAGTDKSPTSDYAYIVESQAAETLVETIMGKVNWQCFASDFRLADVQYPALMLFNRADTGMNSHLVNVRFQFGKVVNEMLAEMKAQNGYYQNNQ